jgi:hypothetical protein
MHYVTHALSPALALTGTTVRSVQCLGSGKLTPERIGGYGNPFPLEAGLFRLREHDMAVDVVLSFFQTARAYTEGFSLYGSRKDDCWSMPGRRRRGPRRESAPTTPPLPTASLSRSPTTSQI